jgi:phosphoribosyl-ATP pyrophosphohydrolase
MRLAKNLNSEGRRALPGSAIREKVDVLGLVEAPAALVAPPQDEHLPREAHSLVPPLGNELDRLYASLEAVTPEDHPRTAKLLASSTRKVAQKVIEEAGEVALAAVKHNGRNIVRESADLLYHLAVLWRRAGVDSAAVWREMRSRADNLGLAEKLPKSAP